VLSDGLCYILSHTLTCKNKYGLQMLYTKGFVNNCIDFLGFYLEIQTFFKVLVTSQHIERTLEGYCLCYIPWHKHAACLK